MKKVLIIEDHEVHAQFMEAVLRRGGIETVEVATTMEEAYEKIPLGWDAILADACLRTESVMDTHELYGWTVTVHKGLLIATSAQEHNRAEQMEFCTHDGGGKKEACDLAIHLLLPPPVLAEAA